MLSDVLMCEMFGVCVWVLMKIGYGVGNKCEWVL